MTPDVFTVQDRHFSVLDHGYLRCVGHWGSDEQIIEAARMSTGKGFLGWGDGVDRCKRCGVRADALIIGDSCKGELHEWEAKPGDEKLLRRLWEHKHATPFEMAGLTVEVQAPIFVFREWHRHRTQSYNEMSARYIPLPDVNYIPSVERLMLNSKTNKQAGTVKGAEELTERSAEKFRAYLESHYKNAEGNYQWALQIGVPKELARVHLPVGRYSRMRASANLRNWLGFLTLRMDPDAQWEIRQYANTVGELVKQLFPRTWELFEEGLRADTTVRET
jgi:thymidylate synthase (FAD)